jgi:drug/metabolite transporter (DMT)-like permease
MDGKTTLGIVLMIAFSLLAPLQDSAAKLIGGAVAVGVIATTRFVFQAALLMPLAAAFGWLHRPDGAEAGLHAARAVLLLVATAFFFIALRYMPIADSIAIFFVEPFILTLLGAVLLGEEVGRRRIIACAVGFAGALLVIQPSFAELGAVALLPLGTALCLALYMVMTRRMAQRMHPIALQGWTATAACAALFPALWAFDGSGIAALDPVRPAGLAVWTLLGVGVMATVAHLFLSFALRLAPAATIAPLQYLEIVAAAAVGYWVFGDFPDLLTWAGVAVIVTSGLYVFARERQLSLRRRPLPPT